MAHGGWASLDSGGIGQPSGTGRPVDVAVGTEGQALEHIDGASSDGGTAPGHPLGLLAIEHIEHRRRIDCRAR